MNPSSVDKDGQDDIHCVIKIPFRTNVSTGHYLPSSLININFSLPK